MHVGLRAALGQRQRGAAPPQLQVARVQPSGGFRFRCSLPAIPAPFSCKSAGADMQTLLHDPPCYPPQAQAEVATATMPDTASLVDSAGEASTCSTSITYLHRHRPCLPCAQVFAQADSRQLADSCARACGAWARPHPASPPPCVPPTAPTAAVRLLEAAPSAAFYVCDLLKAHSAQGGKHRQVGSWCGSVCHCRGPTFLSRSPRPLRPGCTPAHGLPSFSKALRRACWAVRGPSKVASFNPLIKCRILHPPPTPTTPPTPPRRPSWSG